MQQLGGCGTCIFAIVIGGLLVTSGDSDLVAIGAGILFFIIGIPALLVGGYLLAESNKKMTARAKEAADRRRMAEWQEQQRAIAEAKEAREPGRQALKAEVLRRALDEFTADPSARLPRTEEASQTAPD